MAEITRNNGTTIFRPELDIIPGRSWLSWMTGHPLPASDAPHQTVGKAIGLAVFASDALSSTAYATQEVLFILAAAGAVAFGLAFSIFIGYRGSARHRHAFLQTDHPRLSGRRWGIHRRAR